WGDYGGIASETSYLGLDNILKFYTNSDIKDMYKKYLDNFVNRVNTVNNTKYSDDFSIFSWELMNEPRIDINSAGENNYDENYYNGTLLKQWTEEMAKYIKDIDANHMVSLGSELHGIEVDGTTWGGTEEGYGDDPVANVMSAQGIDFVTFHPYPNANWLNYNIPHVKELIQNVVSDSKKLGKPVVMEEWGIDNRYAIKDFQGNIINPDNSKYEALKNTWNNVILSEFRRAGGNGSLVWSFSSLKSADLNFDIVSFMPGEKAIKDSISVSILKFQSLMLDLLSKNIFIDVDEADRGYINEVVYFKLMDNDGYKFHPENNARVSEVSDALKKLKTISDSNMNLKYLEGLNEDDTISRKDLAKDLYNVLNISKVKLNEEENIRYSDLIDCSSDEIDMIKSLYCAGIFSNESEFRPDDNITRAELAKILTGVMDYLSYEGQGYFDSIVVSGSLPNINVTWSKDEVKDKKIVQTGSYGLLPLIYVGLILMVFGSIIVIRKSDFLNN
ncbi:MAG: S-layer homology domain-containing protein, partial [Clostridiaceae bacterium]